MLLKDATPLRRTIFLTRTGLPAGPPYEGPHQAVPFLVKRKEHMIYGNIWTVIYLLVPRLLAKEY